MSRASIACGIVTVLTLIKLKIYIHHKLQQIRKYNKKIQPMLHAICKTFKVPGGAFLTIASSRNSCPSSQIQREKCLLNIKLEQKCVTSK